eukprot:1160404-Pelagomonas_calceolata.AAC.10
MPAWQWAAASPWACRLPHSHQGLRLGPSANLPACGATQRDLARAISSYAVAAIDLIQYEASNVWSINGECVTHTRVLSRTGNWCTT